MKKSLIIIASLFILAIAFSSCKGTQDCPAYGEVPTVEQDSKA